MRGQFLKAKVKPVRQSIDRLFRFFMRSVLSAEFAELASFEPRRRGAFVFSGKIISPMTFCAFKSNQLTHDGNNLLMASFQ